MEDDERIGAGTILVLGLLTTVVGAIVATVAQAILFNIWSGMQAEPATFSGNGRQWLSLGYLFVMPIFNGAVLAVEFMLYLPIRFDLMTRGTGRFSTGRHQVANLVYCTLLVGGFFGVGSPVLLLLNIVPLAGVGAVALDRILPRANRALALGAANTP